MPTPKQHSARPSCPKNLPAPVPQSYSPFVIDSTPGKWLCVFDVHCPYHDPATLERAVAVAKREKVVGLLFGGDFLDCHDLSTHDKDSDAARYVDEIETGRELLKWFRSRHRKARIVVKEGNHEERLQRYVSRHAQALSGLPGLSTPELLDLDGIGAEWVGDKRVVAMGDLDVLHGHEYAGSGGDYPAKWLWQRTHGAVLCGHFHRTSSYFARDLRQRRQSAWTSGCACYLHPKYRRLNDWNHGFALVDLRPDGTFDVTNYRLDGSELTKA